MTNEETLHELNIICMACQGELYEENRDCGHRDECYVPNCMEALKKTLEKKVTELEPTYYTTGYVYRAIVCDCGKVINSTEDKYGRCSNRPKYCSDCGQKVEWGKLQYGK